MPAALAKLPEEFAPTGPKLSKFPIRPAPPVRPRLFSDEARWVLQLAVLAALSECVVWSSRWPVWLVAGIAVLHLTRPLWAQLGTKLPRPAIAIVALPATGDLLASAVGDAITVERRATAYAWLDIGQGIGAALGLCVGLTGLAWQLVAVVALAIAMVLARSLRDRGTPRSTWPLAAYASTLRTPLGAQLAILAALCGGLGFHLVGLPWWASMGAIVIGMALAARIEPMLPNAIWLPRIAVAFAAAGLVWPPSRLLAMGMMFVAIPAAVARGAGEMERPIASSLAWSALFLGAAVGAVI